MLSESLKFIRRHWAHLLLIVPGVFIVTIVHESAHALAVLFQGGTVTQFVWIPSDGNWGFINYAFPDGSSYSSSLISLAPYCLWLLLVIVALAISFRRRELSYWRASLVYMWLFVIPLGDIANTAFPYLANKDNDFYAAFGLPSSIAAWATAIFALSAVIEGYYLQLRLYREDGLSVSSYFALSTVTLLVLTTLAVWRPTE